LSRDIPSEIVLHLDSIYDLFSPSPEEPFSRKALFLPGVELIKSELSLPLWGQRAGMKAMIYLPRESLEPGLAGTITDAWQRYCQFKIQANERTTRTLVRQAFMALVFGTLFLVGGLLLSQTLKNVSYEPPFLDQLFSDGFVIAFWVILWRPVDFFLYELWPYWREDRIYKQMMMIEITVAEEPEA